MPKRSDISSILTIGAVCLLPACAQEADSAVRPQRLLQVRLAQVEELSPQLKAADPNGALWAQRYSENFPVRIARECGVAGFAVTAASDFHQAVEIPMPQENQPLIRCLTTRGAGYLRLSNLPPESD